MRIGKSVFVGGVGVDDLIDVVLSVFCYLGWVGPREDIQEGSVVSIFVKGDKVGLFEFGEGVEGIVSRDVQMVNRFKDDAGGRPEIVLLILIPAGEGIDGYRIGVVALTGEIAIRITNRHDRRQA